MAYDKVVDSAQLDGAMTATADAIRGKTGETAPIVWDAANGFSAAIAAIAEGSGIIVESGVVILTEDATTFDVAVSKAAHDNCFLYTTTADADSIAAIEGRLNAVTNTNVECIPVYKLGEYKNFISYATKIKYLTDTDSAFGFMISLNDYIGGISMIDDTVRFGTGFAARKFRAGVPYKWDVYYIAEADA